MFQSSRKSFVAVGLLAVCWMAAMPALAQKSAPAPQALPVNVENTPSVNVANTANVSVTNTPSVNVANTPAVTLESGASVAVTSPLDGQGNPTPIATLEAVQIYGGNCTFAFNNSNAGNCFFPTVPQGKQLIVQEFDALGSVDSGNRPLTVSLFNTITSGNWFPYAFETSYGGLDYLVTHQETRVYVEGGEAPGCSAELGMPSVGGGYNCDISGFLVDMPTGQQPITAQHQKARLPQMSHSPSR